MFLVVSGIIGAGKTTVTKGLAERTNLFPLYENVEDNPTLEDCYAAMERYSRSNPLSADDITYMQYHAFRTQMFFLTDRWLKHIHACFVKDAVIADRCLYEDQIFAKMLTDVGKMSSVDFHRIYIPMFTAQCRYLRPPDLAIYLVCTPENALQRIKKRGRKMESDISLEFLEMLNVRYKHWIFHEYPYPFIMIPTEGEDNDFSNPEAPCWNMLLDKIRGKLQDRYNMIGDKRWIRKSGKVKSKEERTHVV